jgi:glycosyltransferase involved in cell wall biosynthesis
LREAIVHNETGRLVSFFDPNALTQSVCELLSDQEQRGRLGDNAREFAQANSEIQAVCLPKQLAWVEQLNVPNPLP